MKKNKRKISKNRYNASYDSRDGGRKKSFLDFSKIDKKVTFFEPKEGLNKINIIPYEVKTKNHPLIKKNVIEIGDNDYNLDIYVHRGVGINNETVLCLKKTYGKACPICEEVTKLYDEGKNDEGKSLLPQRRCIYNIQSIVKGEAQDLTIWDVSHFLFEKELIEEAHACLDGKNPIDFADFEDGKTIKFRGTEENFGKQKYLEFKSFSFMDRDEEIDEDIFEKAICLDELLIVPSYDDVAKIYYGMDDDDEDEDEKPVKEKTKTEKTKTVVEDEDEDEDDDDEDDEKPVKKSKKNKCPHGYKFGKDIDDMEECEGCEAWDACMEESDK